MPLSVELTRIRDEIRGHAKAVGLDFFEVQFEVLDWNQMNVIASYAWMGAKDWVHAAAAKAGVWNMAMTLATEWGPYGITINSLAPGAVYTEGVEKARQLTKEKFEAIATPRSPVGRVTTVEEVGQVAAFLVSDMASYITGATIVMDGGTSLHRDRPPERTRRRTDEEKA